MYSTTQERAEAAASAAHTGFQQPAWHLFGIGKPVRQPHLVHLEPEEKRQQGRMETNNSTAVLGAKGDPDRLRGMLGWQRELGCAPPSLSCGKVWLW
ncbi:MAG: hypothetical protein ACR2P1_09335 [Pseudomonadales bacterium]